MSLQNLPITGRRHRFADAKRPADFNGALIDDVLTINMKTSNVSGNIAVQDTVICDTLVVNQNTNMVSGTLYVDGTNHRVGINTTSPADSLHLRGRFVIGSTIGGDSNAVFEFRTENGITHYFYLDQTSGKYISSTGIIAESFYTEGNVDISGALNVTSLAALTTLSVSGTSDFTGNVTISAGKRLDINGTAYATTAASGTNTTQVATTAFVRNEISSLVASAPSTLDTLNELATALGNDANFATTMTNALATKANVTTVNAIDTRLTGAQSNITTLQGNVVSINGTLSNIQSNVTNLQGNVVTINGTLSTVQSNISNLQVIKANLASPTFTGVPTAPTAVNSTNTTQIATTAFVKSVVSDLVASAPAALDTLNELATALGNDSNFATTVTNAIALKANITTVNAIDTRLTSTESNVTTLQGNVVTINSSISDVRSNVTTLQGNVVTINGTLSTIQSNISNLQSLNANLDSPSFTGIPTAPTATTSTNTTQIATTAFVKNVVSDLVASAPATLDTLNELATALGNDSNFSTTITNALALKAPIDSAALTGNFSVDTNVLYVDAINNRVGMNTTTPSADLHVVGNALVTGTITGTLATAAQTNVTSVGTLSSLTVSGATTFNNTTTVNANLVMGSDTIGQTWSSVNSLSDTWYDAAISEDGQYQTVIAINSQISRSTNYGVTWSFVMNGNWKTVSMSSSGEYQSAVWSNGNIYRSSNYGASWSAVGPQKNWGDIAVSGTGEYQTAVESNGPIHRSIDYGVTWTVVDSNPVEAYLYWQRWQSVAMSIDGKYQSAVTNNGQIYYSSDYGLTWTAVENNRVWKNISMSSSGKYQTATVANGQIYRSSNFGVSWSAVASSKNWFGIAVSSSGQYQTATVTNENVYTSSDYGITWTSKTISPTINNGWYGVAMSANGQYQLVTEYNGYRYRSFGVSYQMQATAVNISGTTTVSSHIMPSTDNISDIGSSINRFHDLYIGGNSNMAGNFTVNNNTFVVDSINNRVGVNTDTPTTSLQVVGNVSVSGSVSGSSLNISTSTSANLADPTTANITGSTGDLAWDSDYLYIKISDTQWKRVSLNSF